jgi:sec-independent protein translocase protein TatC
MTSSDRAPDSVDPTGFEEGADDVERSRMTLGEHLDELRSRLIRSAIALTVVFIAAWGFKDQVAEFALAPYEEKARPWLNERLHEITLDRLNADGPATQEELEKYYFDGIPEENRLIDPIRSARADDASSTFFFFLKVCGYAAFLVAGPFVLWQVWSFIAAGLYASEKRAVYRYFPASLLLFFGGVFFGYTYLVPYAYYYLQEMGLEQIRQATLITPYMKFLSTLGLGMGVVFQLPVLMMALTRVGLVDPDDFAKYRGHFIVGAAILAALITPPDPYTQLMMAGPMAVLYEAGLLLARLVKKREMESETGLEDSAS